MPIARALVTFESRPGRDYVIVMSVGYSAVCPVTGQRTGTIIVITAGSTVCRAQSLILPVIVP
jgi:hypothetical protein